MFTTTVLPDVPLRKLKLTAYKNALVWNEQPYRFTLKQLLIEELLVFGLDVIDRGIGVYPMASASIQYMTQLRCM